MTITYSNKSNASRAARKSGLTDFAIVEIDGKFGFKERLNFEPPAPAPEPAPRKVKAKAPVTKAEFESVAAPAPRKAKAAAKKAAASKPARGTKKDQLFAMVTKGATTAEIADAFGWLPHTTRGALSRFCQMYNVEKTKLTSGGTRYKIA